MSNELTDRRSADADRPRNESRGSPAGDRTTAALLDLIARLKAQAYRFVTPTPATHARVLARPDRRRARDLRDVFGWSLPFDADLLDAPWRNGLIDAGVVEAQGDGYRSKVRVSTLGADLLVHSAFPTDDRDAVFFGPDSYRFARLIAAELARCPDRAGAHLVDIGTGAGAGAIAAARLCPALRITMTDINPAALRLARINAQAAGIAAELHQADDLSPIDGELDLVLANPPYLVDVAGRAYRDGGGLHGGEVSLTIARFAVPRLASGGRFILYTGAAIVDSEDRLHRKLAELARAQGCAIRYDELDPDVFGEELETAAYRDVDRIALVAAVIERRSSGR